MGESTNVLTKKGYPEDHNSGDRQWDEYGGVEIMAGEAKAHRMLTARLNYLSQDSPLVQYPAKEACRCMANPRLGDFAKVKRLVRFLEGSGHLRLVLRWQSED